MVKGRKFDTNYEIHMKGHDGFASIPIWTTGNSLFESPLDVREAYGEVGIMVNGVGFSFCNFRNN